MKGFIMLSENFVRVSAKPGRMLLRIGLVIAGLIVLSALVWQGITADGTPDPTLKHLDHNAIILNTGLLVFREGLEAILVLAAITASFVGKQQGYRRPIAAGASIGFLASVITWFVAIAVISAVNAPALNIQAATGLLAIVVLLVIMNWFFHKIYWTGWISLHNKRRKEIVNSSTEHSQSQTLFGLGLLGFSAMYREGFEVVLFLQTLRLQAGSAVVLEGVLIGLFFTAIVGILTFLAHRKLPYKKMLIVTGFLLAMVLVVMVGESAQELQQAGWISATSVPLPIPGWMGTWFAVFPTVESLLAQAIAFIFVIGSYVTARYIQIWRPRRLAGLTGKSTVATATAGTPESLAEHMEK
jgi:high-affinity iron transporter